MAQRIRVKALPKYPVRFDSGAGINVSRANGVDTFRLDISAVASDFNPDLSTWLVLGEQEDGSLSKATVAGAIGNALDQAQAIFDGIANVNGKYRTVATLIASNEAARGTGAIWEAEGFRYQEAASGASDHHVVTAGGVKLYVLPFGDAILPQQCGAKGDSTTDDTVPINTAARAAREYAVALKLPPVSTYYLVSGSLDLTGIRVIDGRGARIRGDFTGIAAATIGTTTSVLTEADIWLEVQNNAGASTTDGTIGIKCLGLRSSKMTYLAWGFDTGLYFDGASGVARNWLDCDFYPLRSYNCGTHVHIDLNSTNYFIGNRFTGGSYYLGSGSKKAGRGTFKVTLAGTAAFSENVVTGAEIGLDGNSQHASHAAFVYADINSSSGSNGIIFNTSRFEQYNAFSTDVYFVNIPTQSSGSARLHVDLEIMSTTAARHLIFVGDTQADANSVDLKYIAARSTTNTIARQKIVQDAPFPYQTTGGAWVPGRVCYDGNVGGLSTPAWKLSSGVSDRTTRAIGDGQLITSSNGIFIGQKYKKPSGQATFLALNQNVAFSVICYDASGNVLSGTSPWYAQSTQMRSQTSFSVGMYQGVSNWLWLHPDVESFYLAWNTWTSAARRYVDIQPEVRFGDDLVVIKDGVSPVNNVVDSSAIATYFPKGMTLDGDANNGYRSTFDLRTTASSSASSSDTTIDATTVTGITTGDRIGIELDTTLISTGQVERQWHHTTVSSVAGSTITLGAALPAAVAAGRRIYVNRWVTR